MATIRGGGAAVESRLCRCPSIESRRSLLSSPEPRLLMRLSLVGAIVVESLRSQELGKSVLKSCGAALESLRLEAMDLMPESAEESRLRRGGGSWRAQGSERARSAKVSRRESGTRGRRGALLPPPPHSRKMSVSWAKDERRRRGPPMDVTEDIIYRFIWHQLLLVA